MQILLSKKASFWHRRMHCLLLCVSKGGHASSDNGILQGVALLIGKTLSRNQTTTTSSLTQAKANKQIYKNLHTCSALSAQAVSNLQQGGQQMSMFGPSENTSTPTDTGHRALFCNSGLIAGTRAFPGRPDSRGIMNMPYTAATHPQQQFSSVYAMSRTAQDLKRFLEEFGTDPREARYWLKNFQRNTDPWKPFAVVQVDQEVFKKPELMDSLGSSISFLLRHDMKAVVVHGSVLPEEAALSNDILQASRYQLTTETMQMVNALEAHGAPAHPLFSGGNVLKADLTKSGFNGKITHVNTQPLEWCLRSGHVPVVSSIGETDTGQLVNIDACHTVEEVAKVLKPLKVMYLNTSGGFMNENSQVQRISSLLNQLPSQSSVVITSANTLLTELFTHRGSGTFFKITEPIHVYHDLDDISLDRMLALLTRAFGRMLSKDYFTNLGDRLHTLYLSENFNACAVITQENEVAVPYLDKFAVSAHSQGEGTSEMLWESVRKDFKSLFWRSRSSNMINPWYFKRSEGSWSNGEWTVFWYGVSDPKVSYELVDYAASLPSSFVEDGNVIVTGR
ncbi:N-acetylglutamate synthase, mitochondrial-like [Saccoglossus kowalevskii]